MQGQVNPTEFEATTTYPVSYYQREQNLEEGLGNGVIDLKIINLYV